MATNDEENLPTGHGMLTAVGPVEVPGCGWLEHDTWTGMGFTLDGVHWAALEDPSDGYRSYMELRRLPEGSGPAYTFPPQPVLVRVATGQGEDFNGWEILDASNGSIVLVLGTDYSDGYYPTCVCDYRPEALAVNRRIANGEPEPECRKDMLARRDNLIPRSCLRCNLGPCPVYGDEGGPAPRKPRRGITLQ